MTWRRVPGAARRAAPGPVVAALAAAVLLAAPAASAAGRLPRCTSFTDARGDGGYKANTATADAALDVTRVTFGADRSALTARIAVAALADNATLAWGDRYQVSFALGARSVEAYTKRSRTRDAEGVAVEQGGLRVDGTYVAGSDSAVAATYDTAASVVTLRVDLAALSRAARVSVRRARLTALRATTYGSFVALAELNDTAEGKSAAFTVAPCV